MRPNEYPEAPTFLGSHQLPLPPEWLPGDDELEPATRAARAAEGKRAAQRVVTERSVARSPAEVTPRSHGNARRRVEERASVSALPLGPAPAAPRREASVAQPASRREAAVAQPAQRREEREPRREEREPRREEREPRRESREEREPRREASRRDSSSSSSSSSSRSRRDSSSSSSSSSSRRESSSSSSSRRESSRSSHAAGTPPQGTAAAKAQAEAAAQAQAQAEAAAQAQAQAAAAQAQAAAPGQVPAAQQLPNGMGAIDPMQVPIPPELAGPMYGWIRRLALQADLAGADRVLRDALADMTSSLSVSIVYPGEDGLWTLGKDDEIPRDAQPIIAVGRARRAVIGSHTALVPVLTATDVVAVVVLTRNPRNPAYHPLEQVAAIALAREAAAILHHLAVQHLQNAAEIKADQGGLYRGEALEAHRSRGQEGQVVQLSPAWVRRTYPILIVTIIVALVAAILVTVPTYSTGTGVVVFNGTPATAPIGGTVDQLYVSARQAVTKGQILARLNNASETAELAAATSDYENATMQYLFDPQDETAKKSLATALTRVERARAQAETRVVRAARDGVVADLRIRQGSTLSAGDTVLTIVQPNTEPEMTAFLPGKDRPRLRVGMTLQIELVGYTKARETATITSISTEIVAGEEIAARILGPGLAGSFRALNGSNWVIVKAKLPSRTFVADKRTNYYHHGLTAKTEVKIQSKPFLVTLLPALDKYIP